MPELFSDCTLPCATVRQTLADGLDSSLVPRLSSTTALQRSSLLLTLRDSRLVESPDGRSLPLCAKSGGVLRTSALYKLCTIGGESDAHFEFVWRNWAPSKVHFFACLLVRGRMQCRANLHRKGILAMADSGCPLCPAPLETPHHIVFECPFEQQFLAAMGIRPDPALSASNTAMCALPSSAPPATASTLRLLFLWHLWKHRNGVVFEGLPPPLSLLRKCCRDAAILWRARLPMEHCADVDLWLTYFLPE
jgi:hypothetical protein